MPSLFQGGTARVLVSITDLQNAPADPGALRLKVKTPSGTVTTYAYPAAVQKNGVGVYQCDVSMPERGKYQYRWESDAPYQGVSQGEFVALASNI